MLGGVVAVLVWIFYYKRKEALNSQTVNQEILRNIYTLQSLAGNRPNIIEVRKVHMHTYIVQVVFY